MPKTYKIHMLLETLSPLTHMMGTNGNEALIAREAVLHNGAIRHIPVISGNAIRHKLVREPGAMFIVGACNLAGKLSIDQLNYLFNGGSLVESSTSCNIRKIADMQSLMPLYRLLGGCLKNQIVSGSLSVGRGMLVCRENVHRINSLLPGEYSVDAKTFPAERFIDQYQYTRGDATKMKDIDFFASVEELPTGDGKDKTNLMIFNGQTIVPGALFYLGFVLNNVSDLELGAFFHSISRWNGMLHQRQLFREKFSIEVIEHWSRMHPDAVALTSWGKDSVVMLHLMCKSAVRFPVVWVRFSDRYNPDCELVRDAFLQKHAIDYHEECFDYKIVRVGDKHWSTVAKKYSPYRLTGIRNDEGSMRLLQFKVSGYASEHSCRPLARWYGNDIFAYIEQLGLPLCPVYGYLGGGRWKRDRLRTHSIAGTTANGIGRTEWEKEYYPDLLRRIESNVAY
jgi:hypothetical protein